MHNAIEPYRAVVQKIPLAVLSMLALTNNVNNKAFTKRDTLIHAVIKL